MTAKIQVELKPFAAPNFAIAVEPHGVEKKTAYALCELDEETLDAMCDEFRTEVFKKAGKEPILRRKA